MNGVFLLLGSNLGDKERNLEEARRQLRTILRSSSIYATGAWGNTDQPEFLNQVIEIETDLSPEELLKRVQKIELNMGRQRFEKWGPRPIDIDILFYKDVVLNSPDLVIPHPEIPNRRFTLVPLNELTNETHPVLRKTISQLLAECEDPLAVTRLSPQQ